VKYYLVRDQDLLTRVYGWREIGGQAPATVKKDAKWCFLAQFETCFWNCSEKNN